MVLNLISSKDSYYSFSSINQELKKENKNIFNQKKWSKINVINTNNEFIILPSKIPEYLKKYHNEFDTKILTFAHEKMYGIKKQSFQVLCPAIFAHEKCCFT